MDREDKIRMRGEQKYKESSKERLTKIAKKKVLTTAVGCLSVVEKYLGFLWGHNEDRELTPEEQQLRDIFYDKVREEIFNVGNNQMRNIQTEIEQYDIEWKRYKITLPVKPEGPNYG